MRLPQAVLCLVVLCAAPALARAESAAVLPIGPSGDVPHAVCETGEASAATWLHGQGVRTTGASDVEHLLLAGDALAGCHQADCAAQVAQRLGVDFVVVVALWSRPHATAPERVAVTLVTQDGRTFGGECGLDHDHAIDAAVGVALDEARQRLSAANRGALRITTTPPGATVKIDGAYSGETPYFHMVEPGRHEVQLDATGYASERRSIVVELHRDTELTATLTRATDAPAGTATHAVTRTEHPVLGPILLGIAGLGLFVPDLAALVSAGCSGATCQQIDELPFALWAGASALAIGAAIVWALTSTPVTEAAPGASAQARGPHVRLSVGPLAVGVVGQF